MHHTMRLESDRTDSDSATNSPCVRVAVTLFMSKEHDMTGPCRVTVAAFAQPTTSAQMALSSLDLEGMLIGG